MLEVQDSIDLPDNFEVRQAIGGGDCFFDSVAQGLKRLKPEMEFTVKSLRKVCKDLAVDNEQLKSKIIKDARNRHDLATVIPDDGVSDDTLWNAYLASIDYTSDSINEMQVDNPSLYQSLTSLKYGNTLQVPIWGRPDIEGQMICKKYNIKLHLIEKSTIAARWLHQVVNSEGSRSIGSIDYNEENTIHIINRGNAHFEPILGTQETQYDKRQSHSLPVIGDMVYEITQQLKNCQIRRKRPYDGCDSCFSIPKAPKVEVEYVLRTFVKCFVTFFKARLEAHCDEAMGKKEKSSSTLFSLSAMGLIVGGMRSVSLPLLGSVLDYLTKEFAKSIHGQKSARVAARSFYRLIGKPDSTKMLVKAAVEIFRSYEEQYMERKNEKLGMFGIALLANYAVTRAIHYIQSQDLQDKEEDLEELSTLIIKGVVLGNDDFRARKAATRMKIEKIFTSFTPDQDKYLDTLYSQDIYKKAGLVKVTNGNNHYYIKKNRSDTRNYGYRIMFEWEEGMLNEWTKEENVSETHYKYNLKLEEIESKVEQIFLEITKEELVSKGDIRELSSVILENFERLWKLPLFKQSNDLLEFVEKLLVATILNYGNFTKEKQLDEVNKVCSLGKSIATNYDSFFDSLALYVTGLCCTVDSVGIIQYLIEKEIVDYQSRGNFLYRAIEHGRIDVVDYLIKMESFYFDDEYVIGMISCLDSVGVIKCLQRDGDKRIVNIRDDEGNSLLHIAARNGSVEVVKYIGQNIPGINFNIENNYGRTPRDLAKGKLSNPSIVKCLKEEPLKEVIRLCDTFLANGNQGVGYRALYNMPRTYLSNVRSDAVTQERGCEEKASFWRAWQV